VTKRIVLLGPTGYTGRLVAENLVRQGVEFTAASRDLDRLDSMLESMGADHVSTVEADLSDPNHLFNLAAPENVLLNCVGPFDLFSMPLVRAVAESGGIYLDVTGEESFVARSQSELDPVARKNGALVVHACAFESALADFLAEIACHGQERLSRLSSYYWHARALMSPGTRLTARLASLSRGHIYRHGAFVPFSRDGMQKDSSFPFLRKGETAVYTPYPEIRFWPSRYDLEEAASFLITNRSGVGIMGHRTARERTIEEILAWHERTVRPGPSRKERNQDEFTVTVLAEALDGKRSYAQMSGRDPYGFSAAMLVWGCTQITEGYSRTGLTGVRSPCEVFGAEAFLIDSVDWPFELSLSTGALPEA
jgi:short subunit dehydrogenase-like uncharacterized protein